MTTIFETERLLVRPWTLDDAEAAFAMYGDPEVTRYTFQGGVTAPDVETVRKQLGQISAIGGNGMGWWAVERRGEGDVMGAAIIIPVENEGPDIEIGWHLARAHWGNGYATETGRGLLGYGFETLGADSLYAYVITENVRSLTVCERLGMKHLGLRPYAGHEEECFVSERVSRPG